MPALLQFEIKRKRISEYPNDPNLFAEHRGMDPRVWSIIRSAAADTYRNGGTFVLVVSDELITVVQRAEAEDVDAAESHP